MNRPPYLFFTNTDPTTLTYVPPPHSRFQITAAQSAVSGTPFDLTVTALDPYGNIDTNYQVTVEDPNVFTKTWVMNPRTLRLGSKPLEEGPPCVEKDAEHLTSFEHH